MSAGAPARAVTGTRWGDRAVRLAGWRPGMIGDPVVSERYALLRRHSHPGARTLDAGCGSGWFALYLASRGNKVTGISFDPAANAAARRRAEILGHDQLKFIDGDLADLSQLAEGLDPFDEIVCFETIEHIHDDGALINGLAKLLRPGGRMFLTTPSDDHRELALDRAAAEAVGGHVRFGYSFSRLGELCAAAGL
ncbi:MAG: class I SAM-dependent methyltransferase, partial [Solirubrobacterales bacterium]|nr:class I SAM-dependent methyltransferase [Solirubrobacterales bacterium]